MSLSLWIVVECVKRVCMVWRKRERDKGIEREWRGMHLYLVEWECWGFWRSKFEVIWWTVVWNYNHQKSAAVFDVVTTNHTLTWCRYLPLHIPFWLSWLPIFLSGMQLHVYRVVHWYHCIIHLWGTHKQSCSYAMFCMLGVIIILTKDSVFNKIWPWMALASWRFNPHPTDSLSRPTFKLFVMDN